MLLRGNGQYHLEHHTAEKVRVFEGNLDSDETIQLVRIVSADQLYRLGQKQITDPMLKVDDDEVILAVLRPQEIWQQLFSPDSQSRDPYRESLVPLLNWLDRLQKRKGRELSEEEGRNNCRPFVNLEFGPRPAKKGEPRANIAWRPLLSGELHPASRPLVLRELWPEGRPTFCGCSIPYSSRGRLKCLVPWLLLLAHTTW